MKVNGKVVIFTGAGSGLGLECVKRLEEMGAIVIAVDRDVSNVPESTRVKPYQLDVTDWNGLKRLYEEIPEKYGRIDVVCNNAGIFEPKGAQFWVDVDAESYPTIEINLTAMIKSTRLAIDAFLKQPKLQDGPIGVIVNTTSIAGLYPAFTAPVYGASKWGTIGFTRSMDYLHPSLGIRCVGLAPGAVLTPLWTPEMKQSMHSPNWVPMNEVVDAMMTCIEDEDIKGGEIYEVLGGKTRTVPTVLPEPGPGVTASMEEYVKTFNHVVNLLQGQQAYSQTFLS